MKRVLYLLLLCFATVHLAQAQTVQITTAGIGTIKVGGNISDMPKSVDGLYDQIASEQKEDMGDTYTCYKFIKDSSTIAQVDDFSNQGEISSVEILSPDFKLEGISVGTPVSQLFNLPKAKQTHQRDGAFYFEIDNVLIKVGEFSEAGWSKLRDAYNAGTNATLTLSDFDNDAAVTSIICNGQTADAAVAMNDDTQSDATHQPDSKTYKTIMNIALLLALGAMIFHMIVTIRSEQQERVFVGSKLRMVLLAALCLFMVIFSIVNNFNMWPAIFQTVGTIVLLTFYYYAYQRPVSLFLNDKPLKSLFHRLPGLWDYLSFDSDRIDSERKKHYDTEIEKAQNKINNEWLDEQEYQKQKSKINDAQFGAFADSLFLSAFKWILIITVTVIYLSLTPFIAMYHYFKNYILYKEGRKMRSWLKPRKLRN